MTRHRSWNRPLSDRGFRMSELFELSERVVCPDRLKLWAGSSHMESRGAAPSDQCGVHYEVACHCSIRQPACGSKFFRVAASFSTCRIDKMKSRRHKRHDGNLVTTRDKMKSRPHKRYDGISSPQRDTMESRRHKRHDEDLVATRDTMEISSPQRDTMEILSPQGARCLSYSCRRSGPAET